MRQCIATQRRIGQRLGYQVAGVAESCFSTSASVDNAIVRSPEQNSIGYSCGQRCEHTGGIDIKEYTVHEDCSCDILGTQYSNI